MKTFIYSLIIALTIGLGILLYGNLQDSARKQQSQQQFQERTESMLENQRGTLRASSPVWTSLPDKDKDRLESIGFQPASLSEPAPKPIQLRDLQGNRRRLEEYSQQWLLLNFWATWCAPCRFEMPSMQQLHERFQDQPFSVIGINLQEPKPSIEPFVRRMELDFPIWMDQEGVVADRFFVTGVPETWLIAPGGRPVARMTGSRDWNDTPVVRAVESLLSTAASE